MRRYFCTSYMKKKTFKSAEELAADTKFIRWVLASDKILDDYWEKLLGEDESLVKLETPARSIVESLGSPSNELSSIESEQLLSSIHDKMHAPIVDQKVVRLRRYAFGIAAGLAILITAFLWLNASSDLDTDFGEIKYVTLDDGTGVHMNANTSLAILGDWNEDQERLVYLRGEAFFDVTSAISQEGRRFSVKTDYADIIVKGTEFNLDVREDYLRVVLTEGQIVLQIKSSGNTIDMLPGDMVVLNKGENGFIKTRVASDNYISWREHQLKCENTPLIQIAERIQNTYGVTVDFENEALKNKRLTGTINNNNLEELTHAIAVALNISINKKGKTLFVTY